jgi:predicted PurR-regulated permease PerM
MTDELPAAPEPAAGSDDSGAVSSSRPVDAAERPSSIVEPGGPAHLDRAEAVGLLRAGLRERLLSARTARQIAVLALAGVLAAAGLYLASSAIVPFIVALLGAYLIMPVVDALAERRVPRWLAILLVYAGLIVFGLFILRFVLPPLIEQMRALIAAIPGVLADLYDRYLELDLAPAVREAIDGLLTAIGDALTGLDWAFLITPIVGSLTGLLGTIFAYVFAPFFIFYICLDKDRLLRGFDRGLPPDWRPDVWAVLGIGDLVFGQWIRSTIILGLILAAASVVGMATFGALIDPVFWDFAIVLATIAFFSEFIPIIGPFFPLIAGVLVGLTVSPFAAIAAGVFYFALAQVEANVLVPRIQGRALSLHPAAVIAILIFGAAAAGLLGALLAMPVVSTVVLVIRYLFRRASGLIDPPAPPPAVESGPLVDDLIPGVPRVTGPVPEGPAP